MIIEKLKEIIDPPCSKCPYKLGLINTFMNPCPQCKEEGYETYKRFTNRFNDYNSKDIDKDE